MTRTPAKTMPHVKLDIHRKNIAVCAFLDSPVKTVKMVSTLSNVILFSNKTLTMSMKQSVDSSGLVNSGALFDSDYFTEKELFKSRTELCTQVLAVNSYNKKHCSSGQQVTNKNQAAVGTALLGPLSTES